MTARIRIELTLKDELLQEFLQHIRNFDARHMQDIQLQLGVEVPNMKGEELERILKSIKPPFPLFVKGNAQEH
jgi:hypothetical protein